MQLFLIYVITYKWYCKWKPNEVGICLRITKIIFHASSLSYHLSVSPLLFLIGYCTDFSSFHLIILKLFLVIVEMWAEMLKRKIFSCLRKNNEKERKRGKKREKMKRSVICYRGLRWGLIRELQFWERQRCKQYWNLEEWEQAFPWRHYFEV